VSEIRSRIPSCRVQRELRLIAEQFNRFLVIATIMFTNSRSNSAPDKRLRDQSCLISAPGLSLRAVYFGQVGQFLRPSMVVNDILAKRHTRQDFLA